MRTKLGDCQQLFAFAYSVAVAAVGRKAVLRLNRGRMPKDERGAWGASESVAYSTWLEWASALNGSGMLVRETAPGVTLFEPQFGNN